MNNNNDELNNALYRVALVLDKGLESTRELAAGYVETMGLGVDRSVRNLSYFFDGYEDVYENIKYEDDRFFLMVKETFKGNNPIRAIIIRYLEHLFTNLNDDEMNNLKTLLRGVFLTSGALVTTGGVRVYIATAASELIYNTVLRNAIAHKLIRGGGNIAMAFVGGYGIIEMASQAKERLRYSNPTLYYDLVLMNLEMGYFIVEPNISKWLYMIGSEKKSVDEVYRAINGLIYN